MKLFSALILAAMSCAAAAADRDVRILASAFTGVTGDTVPADRIVVILFTHEPCPLEPFANDRHILRAWQNTGAYQLGCWYPTLEDGWDEGWMFIGQVDSLTHNTELSWRVYPRAKLHEDGSATITEPNYDGSTFMANFLRERSARMVREIFEHQHEKP